jgi:hypothetical protein
MVKWSFEVRHGGLAVLPSALASRADEQRKANARYFLMSEAGNLLNEPDEQIVHSIPNKATPADVIGGVSKSLAWLLDHFELELNQDFQCNYLKVSFVNLQPVRANEVIDSGLTTTNVPELPETTQTSPALQFRQMVMALRVFFSHLQAAVEVTGWGTETFACDWVSMTFSKVS